MSTIVVTCSTGQGPAIGGSGLTARRVARGLYTRGHKVHWFGLGENPNHPQDWGLIYHQVDPVNKVGLWNFPNHYYPLVEALVRFCLKEKVDVLHAHYLYPWGYAVLEAARILHGLGVAIPVIMRPAGTDIWELGKQMPVLTRAILCGSDHVICNTPGFLNDLLAVIRVENFPEPSFPFTLIPNPVPAVFTRAAPTFRRSLGIPDSTVVVTVTGNFRSKQRAPLAVEIFAEAASETSAILLLVGEGPELPEALQRAKGLGIGDRVISVGLQLDMPLVLSSVDLALHPSRQDSFGNFIAEAGRCGVPVVSTQIGGIPDVITDGETGFLCAAEDKSAYVQALRRLILDESLRRKMGASAVVRVSDLFDSDKIVARYEEVLLTTKPRC